MNRLTYTVPEAFKARLEQASEIDSLTVIERDGRLLGRVALTLDVPGPQGIHPVGIDLNETNALVAMDTDDRTLFISGKAVKVANYRTFKTRKRLQRKLATRKAEHGDTRSVRRVLKRLGRKRSNRTRTFAQTAAKQLVTWAPSASVLVFEDLQILQPQKGRIRGTAIRRRLSQWQHALIRQYAQCRAEEQGMLVTEVDPAYTSKTCSRCGVFGQRKRHRHRQRMALGDRRVFQHFLSQSFTAAYCFHCLRAVHGLEYLRRQTIGGVRTDHHDRRGRRTVDFLRADTAQLFLD